MAQVDDGAMRNCIGLHVWNSYGHCLGTLTPTKLRVSIANNNTIPCKGLWSGEVSIGGTKSHTHFAVFNCKGAFDVILGKPWLKEVDAVYYYKTDTITINTGTNQTTIDNKEQNTNNRFTESRWAKYLDIDEMEEEEHNPQKPSTRVEWFTTKVEKRETEKV